LFGRQPQEITVEEYQNEKGRKGGLVKGTLSSKLQLWATLGKVLDCSGAVDCVGTMSAKGHGKSP